MDFIYSMTLILGGAIGFSLTVGSLSALTYTPGNPDWVGFLITLALGLLLLFAAFVSYLRLKDMNLL